MQVEVGDMIHWHQPDPDDTDIGWVVCIENRTGMERDEELNTLIYIQWVLEDCTDHLWEQSVLEHPYMTITKGGRHD